MNLVVTREGALVVQLAAPPVDGAANEELIEVLAAVLVVPRRGVRLEQGGSGASPTGNALTVALRGGMKKV